MARRTIASDITATGVALHAGTPVRMTLSPAAAGSGVVFHRSDLNVDVPARYDGVTETNLGTVIAHGGASVGVVEHLMAAVAGAEIDDLRVTLDGPEPPILDGDSLSYLALIEAAGIAERDAPRRAVKVLKRVEVSHKGATAALEPAEVLSYDMEIDFPTRAIGRQAFALAFSREAFRREIAPARTFGFVHELEALRRMNRGNGASLDNTLAIDGDAVVNAALMRFPDEFVRHKILDAIGDMALAGAPLIARFEGRRSGHGLNNALLRALFAEPASYRIVSDVGKPIDTREWRVSGRSDHLGLARNFPDHSAGEQVDNVIVDFEDKLHEARRIINVIQVLRGDIGHNSMPAGLTDVALAGAVKAELDAAESAVRRPVRERRSILESAARISATAAEISDLLPAGLKDEASRFKTAAETLREHALVEFAKAFGKRLGDLAGWAVWGGLSFVLAALGMLLMRLASLLF